MTETKGTAADMTTPAPRTGVWPSLRYRDAPAAIEFLVDVFGFERVEVYLSDDGSEVEHAELSWPLGGGLMLGSARETHDWPQLAGHAALYVVTDDPDGLYERAVAAGARVTHELRDEDYGSRGFAVRDLEDNLWSFGTYAGGTAEDD
jgi:uncharacterized glyoxalase superfamily protein PhnB